MRVCATQYLPKENYFPATFVLIIEFIANHSYTNTKAMVLMVEAKMALLIPPVNKGLLSIMGKTMVLTTKNATKVIMLVLRIDFIVIGF
jgi:hypothetical protein